MDAAQMSVLIVRRTLLAANDTHYRRLIQILLDNSLQILVRDQFTRKR